jgi:hypothetical protein
MYCNLVFLCVFRQHYAGTNSHRHKSIEKCFDLFTHVEDAFIKDIKNMIPKSSFYESVCPEIERINKIIEDSEIPSFDTLTFSSKALI